MENKFMEKFIAGLDLALEAHEVVRGQQGGEIPGVIVDKEDYDFARVTTVKIEEVSAEKVMGKPIGSYITIESTAIRQRHPEIQNDLEDLISKYLSQMIALNKNETVLIVGLGNWHATPDSLGPRVVEYTPSTRHLFSYAPDQLAEGMNSVCSLAPGVLGITGMETAEIIKGVVEKIKPKYIIAIDSLAARSVDRIATTIQLANTGINPGSGVGNQRSGINEHTMGIPVIAIGVPTIVHAGTIAADANQNFYNNLASHPNMNKVYKRFPQELMEKSITEVLMPFGGDLMVTPREIDDLIQYTARTVAGGISGALHPGVSSEQLSLYLN